MRRSKSGSGWIVQKLIERDNINHHYRRLNSAQSQLQLNNPSPKLTRNRLSKSNNDLRFENQLRRVEDQMGKQFYLDVTPLASEKRREMSDESQDVMARHSQYFTHPSKQFTPRIVRKIVRPQSSPPKRMISSIRSITPITPGFRSSTASARTPRKIERVLISADPQRNVSDDSAFGDEHSTESSSDSSTDSLGGAEFNIRTWLKEQEEENRYMQLMCDVTADLLQRSLCTNGGMKEILNMYVRKSKKKFEVSSNVLMKRLCEDLMIPLDSSFDDHYYGSRRSAIANQANIHRRHQEDPRNQLKEIQYSDHLQAPLNKTRQRDTLIKSQNMELTKPSPTLTKFKSFDFDRQARHEWLNPQTTNVLPTEENNQTLEQFNPTSRLALAANQQMTQTLKATDAEGYFSDFTNDTENDIEEEFDFD